MERDLALSAVREAVPVVVELVARLGVRQY